MVLPEVSAVRCVRAGTRPCLSRTCGGEAAWHEALPLAFLMEKAGGASSDGAVSILDLTVRTTDDRTQVALGSAGEVRRFDEMVGPAAAVG